MRRALALLLAAACLLASHASRAGTAEQCVADAERAQLVRDKNQFLEAKRRFIACSNAACPDVVKGDCQRFLTQLEPRIPSVVLVAKDEHDADVIDVRVTMDGVLFADKLGAFAIEVDPGAHVFRFERAGSPHASVQTTVMVREGEKGRPVRVVIPSEPPAKVVVAPSAPEPTPIPTLTWVLSGVAVAGGATFAALFTSSNGDVRELEKSCAPFCSDDRVTPIETKFIVADVSLVVGGAAAIGAVVSYLLRPRAGDGTDATTAAMHRAPRF